MHVYFPIFCSSVMMYIYLYHGVCFMRIVLFSFIAFRISLALYIIYVYFCFLLYSVVLFFAICIFFLL